MKPTHKPANFAIYREDGREVVNPTAYRLRIRALREFMENEAESSGDRLTMINTITRNSWTVTPERKWV